MLRWWNVTPDEYYAKRAEVQEFMMTSWIYRNGPPPPEKPKKKGKKE
jgi:hypothetical protein